MTTKSKSKGLTQIAIVSAAALLVWAASACNGILGNEILEADSGAPGAPANDAATDGAVTCPTGQKFCSAINSCGPTDDTAFGCGGATCDPCSIANAMPTCGGTGCTIKSCYPGFEVCNNACVDISEAANCGGCGAACVNKELCAPNGNGTFACVKACLAGTTQCGTQCVDTASAVAHCGGCTNDCRMTPGFMSGTGQWTCADSKCSLTCNTGFHKCGSGGDTCVREDAASCGPSCTACPSAGPNATEQCVQLMGNQGQCTIACLPSPAGHHFEVCAGSPGCVDTSSDPNNCGGCNKKCEPIAPTGATICSCNDGKCSSLCR